MLQSVTTGRDAEWVFAATSPTDREVARLFPWGLSTRGMRLRLVEAPSHIQRGHYEVVGGLLSRTFHGGMRPGAPVQRVQSLLTSWQDFKAVNRAYAVRLSGGAAESLLIQDHQLICVASELQRLQTDSPRLHYFHHTPWCDPESFGLLPAALRRDLLLSALSHDTIGFHSSRWATAFVNCCERFLPEAVCTDNSVSLAGRTARLCVAPGAVDVHAIRESVRDLKVTIREQRLRARATGRLTVVRVERWTPSKNALCGFLAFEELLTRSPALASRVWFLAVLTLPRRLCAETGRYHERCRQVVLRVNERFRNSARNGNVITLIVNDASANNRAETLAAMRIADVVLVNSILDGLNLVAKEACVAARGELVLILSAGAGAADELGEASLLVNPTDVVDTALALERGVTMSQRERSERAHRLRKASGGRSTSSWVEAQAGSPRV